MKFQEAFQVFTKTLKKDKALYQAYQANIAMAYYDCARWEGSRDSSVKRHAIGNRAATYFLDLLLRPTAKPSKGKPATKPNIPLTDAKQKKRGKCTK